MPDLYLFGGPNGAGKSTLALKILPALSCREFVNADAIARGLSPLNETGVALQAGRLMLQRLKELSESGADFAFESTIAGRSFVTFIEECQARGYTFNLIYVWLPHADMNVARVAARVKAGGHGIPEETIRRRYEAGRKNFVELYKPLAHSWRVFDNSGITENLIAKGGQQQPTIILNDEAWRTIHAGYERSTG